MPKIPELLVTRVEERLVLELVDAVVEVGEDRKKLSTQRVDDPVEQLPGIIDRPVVSRSAGRTSVKAGACLGAR